MNMKARNILIVTLLLTAFSVQPLEAQRTFPLQNKASLKTEGHGAFWQSPSIGLTEVQEKELESLQQAYMAEAMPLRRELILLRLELRHLIRDPNVQSKILLDRQKRISELQVKLDNFSFSFQMKARSILTKEQLERLPEDCLVGMGPGFGMDTGTRRGVWEGSHR
jgi:Spy/CpxP family protein refolding chaperone